MPLQTNMPSSNTQSQTNMPLHTKLPLQPPYYKQAAPRTLFWPQENNFKAVLESIRDLMNEETIIPEWLTNIFLGYGDPAGVPYE